MIRLRVHPDNVRARRLYDSLGYAYTGVDRGEFVRRQRFASVLLRWLLAVRNSFATLRIVVDERQYARLLEARGPSLDPGARSDYFPLYRRA